MENTKVLAVVAGREITEQDVQTLINSLDPQSAAQFNSEESRKRLLPELINQELLYLDALDNSMQNDEEYVAEVEKAKVNMLKQYALSKLLRSVSVDEGEIISFYNKHKSYFKTTENIRASHILVSDEGTANDILEEIKSGLPFEDAAARYSTCPSKDVGGDLGYFGKGSMVPEFEEAAFELEVESLSQPVKTQFGYHLIKLTGRQEGRQKSLGEVREQLVQQILLKKQQDLYLSKAEELKGKYEVKVNI